MPRKQSDDEAKRAFTHGSGGANADMAVEAAPVHEDRHIEVPHAREVAPLKKGEARPHGGQGEVLRGPSGSPAGRGAGGDFPRQRPDQPQAHHLIITPALQGSAVSAS